jgi:hypothetical protein
MSQHDVASCPPDAGAGAGVGCWRRLKSLPNCKGLLALLLSSPTPAGHYCCIIRVALFVKRAAWVAVVFRPAAVLLRCCKSRQKAHMCVPFIMRVHQGCCEISQV